MIQAELLRLGARVGELGLGGRCTGGMCVNDVKRASDSVDMDIHHT
jgi:hypothetical protein